VNETTNKDYKRDIDELISPGHVLGHRLMDRQAKQHKQFKQLIAASALSLIAAVSVSGLTKSAGTFQANPAEAVQIPGYEGRYDYRLADLGRIPAEQGMTQAEFQQLVTETANNVKNHGNDVASFEYGIQGKSIHLTSNAKVFKTETAHLKTGIVSIDKSNPAVVYVSGFVNGKLEILSVGNNRCLSLLGETCQSQWSNSQKQEHIVNLFFVKKK
jgi:hypothetical protein